MLNHTSSRIILTGDFLRPAPDGFSSVTAKDILWLHRLFGSWIRHVSAQPPALVGWGVGSTPADTLGDDDIAAIYAEHDEPHTVEGWVKLKDSQLPSPHLDALVASRFAQATIIGFELPAILQKALLRNGSQFIDIRLHPAGFADDLLLAFRASAPHIQAKLAAQAIPAQLMQRMADLAGAEALFHASFQPSANSLLVMGQSNNPAARLSEFQELICTAAHKHDATIVPASEPFTLALLQSWGIAAEAGDAPLYCLLSHPHVSHVLALDGDRATEAQFFGKHVRALRPPECPLALNGNDPARYYCIDGKVFTSTFWSDLLERPSPSFLAIAPRPNRLRRTRGLPDAATQQDQHSPAHMGQEGGLLGQRLEDLRLQQMASRSDMQVRLAGLEHELHRAQVALTAATRWQSDEMMHRKRTPLGRMVFRSNGRPTKSLRKLLFHASGKPRGLFRSWIITSAGEPRSWMRQWMMSPEYLAHPNAHHAPSLRPVLAAPRPFTAWRSVAGMDDLSPEDLDALMNAVRAEVQASQVPAHG